MNSTTDIQHYADSASKGSYRPSGNTGIGTQNSGSWMLDLVSQHNKLKPKPAFPGKQAEQTSEQGTTSAQPAVGVPSGMSNSAQAAVQSVQGASAPYHQPKKK